LVFGCVSVISDAWKGLGPIFILALYRAKRQWSAAGAAAIWIVCFSYSISSALGVAIEDRSSRTGNRETMVRNYDETVAEEKRLEEKRKGLRRHRSVTELEVPPVSWTPKHLCFRSPLCQRNVPHIRPSSGGR
jgi:hypothetical protein